jgi:tRNA A-37 threonylcarbamoyl transferase component Bud32
MGLLNRLAYRASSEPQRLHAFLSDIADHWTHSKSRTRIWTEMLRGCGIEVLIQELRQVDLSSASKQDLDRLLEVLGKAGLSTLVDAIQASESPLSALASWSAGLVFDDGTKATLPSVQDYAPQASKPVCANDREARDWILTNAGLTSTDIEALVHPIEALVEVRTALVEGLSPTNIVAQVANARLVAEELREALMRLPPIDPARLAELEETVLAATTSMSKPVYRALLNSGLSPSSLREAVELYDFAGTLESAPLWLFRKGAIVQSGDDGMAARLSDDGRPMLRVLQQLSQELGSQALALLATLNPPADGISGVMLIEHVQNSVRRQLERIEKLSSFAPEVRAWAARYPHDEGISLAEKLVSLQDRLSPEVGRRVLDEVVSSPNGVRVLEEFGRAVDKYEREMRESGKLADYGALRYCRQHLASMGTEAASRVEMVRFGAEARHARLLFNPAPDGSHGWASVPIRICCQDRRRLVIDLEVTVLGRPGATWPATWPQNNSRIEVEVDEWRERDGPLRFVVDATVNVWMRTPGDVSRVTIRLASPDRDISLPSADPEFEVASKDEIQLEWPSGSDPRHVKLHPIGVQKKEKRIRDRIRSGESVLAIAPRRFGKSTLLAYLSQLDEPNWIVLRPISTVAARYATDIDFPTFWRLVSDSLFEKLRVNLGPGLSDWLPAETAFDTARRVAGEERTIVLLIDEAQALVPRGTEGARRGRLLKRILETNWGVRSPGMARLVFVFAGLPGIRNVGADAQGAIRTLHWDHLDEGDINTLVLAVSRRVVQTTKEARERIAEIATNLAMLRDIMEELFDLARKERRTWVTLRDVEEVQRAIGRRVRAEPQHIVRDVLNVAENPDDWQPTRTYPVALALAQAREDGYGGPHAIEQAERLLKKWSGLGDGVRFDRVQLEAAAAQLEEEGVVDSNRAIGSTFLQQWLVGQLVREVDREDFRSRVERLGAPHVKSPPNIGVAVGSGRQATLYCYLHAGPDGAEPRAFRESRRQDVGSGRFRESLEMMLLLRDELRRPGHGKANIFNLLEVGLVDSEEDVAAQIYTWIQGEDLRNASKAMPAATVAFVGWKLASAVAWLHDLNILHRDICPRNIIMEDTVEPRLIDFGLASSAVPHSLMTNVEGDFSAPEVRRDQGDAKWSRAADVYSLGVTLKFLWKAPSEARLTRLLSRMTGAAQDRPTMRDVHGELEQLQGALRYSQRAEESFAEFRNMAAHEAVHQVLTGLGEVLRGVLMVAHSPTGAMPLIADFLNQVSERALGVSLGKAQHEKGGGPIAMLQNGEVIYTAKLRNLRSHSKEVPLKRKDIREEMKALHETAVSLSRAIGNPSLPIIVGHLLEPYRVEIPS